jgi:hypothetical protein
MPPPDEPSRPGRRLAGVNRSGCQASPRRTGRRSAVWLLPPIQTGIGPPRREVPRVGDADFTVDRAERDGDRSQRLDAVLGALFEACSALGPEVAAFLPDAAVRIIRQCTPRDGTLPPAVPVFRRLSPKNSAREPVSSGGGPAPGR